MMPLEVLDVPLAFPMKWRANIKVACQDPENGIHYVGRPLPHAILITRIRVTKDALGPGEHILELFGPSGELDKTILSESTAEDFN